MKTGDYLLIWRSGKKVIQNPSIQKVKMHGQESFQISGDDSESSAGFTEEDIKLVAEKTGKTEEKAKIALEETKDIAEAIIKLSRN
mgnify:CR=1 FL=1